MLVITYWFFKKISLRGFLARYKGINDLSLNWSDQVAFDYYSELIFKKNA